jgi:hypothetical protein
MWLVATQSQLKSQEVAHKLWWGPDVCEADAARYGWCCPLGGSPRGCSCLKPNRETGAPRALACALANIASGRPGYCKGLSDYARHASQPSPAHLLLLSALADSMALAGTSRLPASQAVSCPTGRRRSLRGAHQQPGPPRACRLCWRWVGHVTASSARGRSAPRALTGMQTSPSCRMQRMT